MSAKTPSRSLEIPQSKISILASLRNPRTSILASLAFMASSIINPFRLATDDVGNLSNSYIQIYGSRMSNRLVGGKHVLTFTDDHTNHGIVYVLKNKSSSTILDTFKEYQAWAERQCGHKIKELRTDRGTEYIGDMIEFVKSQGIEHNPTAGYSPQSNS